MNRRHNNPPYALPNGYGHYPFYGGWPYDPYAVPVPLHAREPFLNPVLSLTSPTVVSFDVKKHPHDAVSPEIYRGSGTDGVHLWHPNPPKCVQVMSKAFPWIIEIKQNYPVVCKDVWKKLHDDLQHPITETDWAHIARSETLKRSIRKAHEKRVKPENRASSPIRRIDYLGEATIFAGLEKDEDYVRSMLIPGVNHGREIWVAKFTRPTRS